MKQGHNNFKNYVFYIVCEDNTKETTIFMEGDNDFNHYGYFTYKYDFR